MDFEEDGDNESLLPTLNEGTEDGELSDYSANSAEQLEWEKNINQLLGHDVPPSPPKEVLVAIRKNSAAAKSAAAAAESTDLVDVPIAAAERAAEAAKDRCRTRRL